MAFRDRYEGVLWKALIIGAAVGALPALPAYLARIALGAWLEIRVTGAAFSNYVVLFLKGAPVVYFEVFLLALAGSALLLLPLVVLFQQMRWPLGRLTGLVSLVSLAPWVAYALLALFSGPQADARMLFGTMVVLLCYALAAPLAAWTLLRQLRFRDPSADEPPATGAAVATRMPFAAQAGRKEDGASSEGR